MLHRRVVMTAGSPFSAAKLSDSYQCYQSLCAEKGELGCEVVLKEMGE